jgi:hypothetical protein
MDSKQKGIRVAMALVAILVVAAKLPQAHGKALAAGSTPTVYQATLGENETTAEVTTDELWAILKQSALDGCAAV